MRSFVALVALSAALLAPARAGELRKPYFAATVPGAWARYVSTCKDGSKLEYTYRRLPDEDGRTRLDIATKIVSGPGSGSEFRNLNVMTSGFEVAKDALSYGRFVDRVAMQFGDAPPMVQAPEMVKAIRDSASDFRNAVDFEAAETVDGHACDRYAFAARAGGPAPSTTSGKLWLDPAVPFGLVRQTGKVTQADGAVMSEFEMVLQASGSGEVAAAPAAPAPAAPAGPVTNTVAAAYKAGKVGFAGAVVAGTGGRRLQLVPVNKTESDLVVTLPQGDMEFEAGSPVNVLKVTWPAARTVTIPAGEAGDPIEAVQRAGRGPIEGKFEISIYEGTPLCSGSMTIGTLAK